MVSKLLMLFGDTLFAITMGNFANLYECNYEGTEVSEWRHKYDSGMQCFRGAHLNYMYVSSFLLLTYLLSATTLFPTFQFDEPTLDIKFSANYVVLRTQCEVFIVFVTTIIDNTTEGLFSSFIGNGLSSSAIIIQVVYVLVYKPCIVRGYNKAEAYFILFSGVPIFAKIVYLLSKNSLATIIFLVFGTVVMIVLGCGSILIFRKKQKMKKKTNKVESELAYLELENQKIDGDNSSSSQDKVKSKKL